MVTSISNFLKFISTLLFPKININAFGFRSLSSACSLISTSADNIVFGVKSQQGSFLLRFHFALRSNKTCKVSWTNSTNLIYDKVAFEKEKTVTALFLMD